MIAAIGAAERGDAQAQTRLGFWYFSGQGGQPDYAQAAEWFSKAAEQGNAVAQCQLDNLYVTGQGVTKDLVKSAKWCTSRDKI